MHEVNPAGDRAALFVSAVPNHLFGPNRKKPGREGSHAAPLGVPDVERAVRRAGQGGDRKANLSGRRIGEYRACLLYTSP
ncbi:MAG: hypothetical protein QUU85_12605, partial [Candidatus Eisenbacteria bacterium]|nr:hypothetical protein [Candidatus Eisenbacteria bacterium]